MTKTSQTAFLWFRSGNRKAVVSRVEPSAIQNPKWLGLLIIALVLVAGGAMAQAQQANKVVQIGILDSGSASDPRNALGRDAFRQGLRELGYVEGENIRVIR
jgi:putative tryptophan/tyrosine transport system substrate-binding protein